MPAVIQGLRSLAQHKLRTFLSTLGVLFGVAAVVAMLSIGEGAKRETLTQIEQLGMKSITIRQNELSKDQLKMNKGLTEEDFVKLQNGLPGFEYLAALKVVKAPVSTVFSNISPEILAVSKDFNAIKGLGLSEGRFLCDLDINKKNQVCVLGSEIAKSLGKYGHAGQTILIDNTQYHIVGVLKNKSWKAGKTSALTTRNFNKNIFIPLGGNNREALSEIIVQIEKTDQLNQAFQIVKRIMKNTHNGVEDYQIIIPKELLAQAFRTQYTFNLVLGSIAAISLLVGGIGIMNIMLANVSERTREIGIRRAVGANKFHIAYQFLVETMLLTLIGAVAGVIFGIIFAILISSLANWTTIITWWSVFLSLFMAVGVGGFSGLYPALKAASMDPIRALRDW